MDYKGTKLNVMVSSAKGVTENKDRYVRMNVANNSSTPPEVLTTLAEDEDYYVGHIVAAHTSTPVSVLVQLAEDEEGWVREMVSGNSNTPPETLAKLAEDKEWGVRYYAHKNLTYLQYRAVQDGACAEGVPMPVEWLKQMYLT